MPKEPADPELAEFASDTPPHPPADPEFRERLRAELWELISGIVAAEGD